MKKISQGYTILIGVLILAAVGLSVTIAVLSMGIDSSQSSLSVHQLSQAKALANACAEYALEQIREDTEYSGTDTLSLGNDECEYTVIQDSDSERTIRINATVRQVTRKLEIHTENFIPQIDIVSWEEVADF